MHDSEMTAQLVRIVVANRKRDLLDAHVGGEEEPLRVREPRVAQVRAKTGARVAHQYAIQVTRRETDVRRHVTKTQRRIGGVRADEIDRGRGARIGLSGACG